MEKNISIRLEVNPEKYIKLRESFISKSEIIIRECLHMDEDNLEEYYNEQFTLHFDDKGKFQFASEEAITGFFHIDTGVMSGSSAMDLAMAAELILSEQLNLHTYIVASAINESIENQLK